MRKADCERVSVSNLEVLLLILIVFERVSEELHSSEPLVSLTRRFMVCNLYGQSGIHREGGFNIS